MKISTKFFTGATVSLGLIIAILIGNTVVVQQIRQIIREKINESTETVKVVLAAENALKSEIIELKDAVLLKDEDATKIKSAKQFLELLNQLENLMPNEGLERFMDDESKYFSSGESLDANME